MHRRYIEALGVVKPGARTLEVGCGNGSISAWLAECVSPCGKAVAVDLDLSVVKVRAPNLELRQGDIVAGPIERGSFDLVTARAVLHHVADAHMAIKNLVEGVRPGGAILLIEPDFLPVSVAEPPEVRTFWDGWLAWANERGVDYQIGRKLAPQLAAFGLTQITGRAETAIYNGGSPWANYWTMTVSELRDDLINSGKLNDALVHTFLRYCAESTWWTQTIAFTAVQGRGPEQP